MEIENSLSLNKLCNNECIQPSNYCFSIKQELNETKRKLVLLEERVKKIEELNKVNNINGSIIAEGSKLINRTSETVPFRDNDISGP